MCQWNNDSELTPVNCSLTGGGGEVQQDDCLSGNTTYNSRLLECRYAEASTNRMSVFDDHTIPLSVSLSLSLTRGPGYSLSLSPYSLPVAVIQVILPHPVNCLAASMNSCHALCVCRV